MRWHIYTESAIYFDSHTQTFCYQSSITKSRFTTVNSSCWTREGKSQCTGSLSIFCIGVSEDKKGQFYCQQLYCSLPLLTICRERKHSQECLICLFQSIRSPHCMFVRWKPLNLILAGVQLCVYVVNISQDCCHFPSHLCQYCVNIL